MLYLDVKGEQHVGTSRTAALHLVQRDHPEAILRITFRNIDKSHRGRAKAEKSTAHKSNVVENMEKPSERFLGKWKDFQRVSEDSEIISRERGRFHLRPADIRSALLEL